MNPQITCFQVTSKRRCTIDSSLFQCVLFPEAFHLIAFKNEEADRGAMFLNDGIEPAHKLQSVCAIAHAQINIVSDKFCCSGGLSSTLSSMKTCARTCNPIAVQAKHREEAITLQGEAGDIASKGQYWQYWQAVELKHGSEKDPICAYADLFMWSLPHVLSICI
jgi:hypothetical protein